MRKAHHISEVTITDDAGKRMVYGIPVYNYVQEEYTFSATEAVNVQEARKTGITKIPLENGQIKYKVGRDELYTQTTTPGYATSFC